MRENVKNSLIILQLLHILRTHLGTALAIYSGRYDATCIAGTLATWEEALETDVLEGFSITHDAHRGRGASLGGYQDSLIGEKTVGILAEGLEAFLQTLAHEIGHPEMERTADQAWGITALR